MKRISFFLLSLILLIIFAINVDRERNLDVKLQLGENSYMEDINILQKKDGIIRWETGANRAVFLNNHDVQLSDLKIKFPENDLFITSNSGMYNIEDKNLKIEGDIKASTKDYDISAKRLFWDSSKNELFSDEKVQISGKRFFVDGDTMTATGDKARLNKNVKAVFYGK